MSSWDSVPLLVIVDESLMSVAGAVGFLVRVVF